MSYLKLPYMPEDPYVEAALQAPPSPDYVPGPEEPEHAPPSPDYVPGPGDICAEIVVRISVYAEDASPTAQSPDSYDGDDEMDIEEDEDDDIDIETVFFFFFFYEVDEDDARWIYCPSAEETEAIFGGVGLMSCGYTTTLPCISYDSYDPYPRALPSTAWSDSESYCCSLGYRAATIRMRAEAAATSHSLPLPPPFILSPTRPDAPPPMPTSAPTSLPPLLLPSASHREDRPEVNLPPRKRLGIALGPSYEVGESSAAAAARPAGGLRADYGFVATMDREIRRDPERYVGYGITDSWDEIVETLQGAPVSTDTELGAHVRDFESMVRRDTDEIYTIDRRGHAHTRLLMETEARMSREAWGKSMDASDLARAEVMSLRTTVLAQMSEITELQSADHSRRRAISDLLETDRGRHEEMRELRADDRTQQQQIIQTLTVMQTLQRKMIPLQGLVTTLQGQVTALQGQVMTLQGQVTALQGQQGPAGGPAQPELPEEAGSSS
ncbi:hypothetical protein Tco_1428109 [Tanacetum coccineum]